MRFTRNIANIVMDVDVEHLGFRAFGGADAVVVNDLAGTHAESVDVDLSTIDGQPDTVTALGTDGVDRVTFANADPYVVVKGLAAQTRVSGGEAALDNLQVSTLGGADLITMAVGVTAPMPINADGGDGDDTATYGGSVGDDQIDIVANGPEVSTFTTASARLDTAAIEHLKALGGAGADTITATGSLVSLTAITMDGGDGDDVLRGGNGADLLLGGNGHDEVDGNQGADRALLGSGDDRFQWDPGDGNDTIDGQAGTDTLDFFGSNGSEIMEASADGSRVRFTRNLGTIVMDFDGIERLTVRAFGGIDSILVGELAGTEVDDVDIDLGAIGGGGDGQADTLTVNGREKRDNVAVTTAGTGLQVDGLPALTGILGSEPTLDTLRIQTLGGNDSVTVGDDVDDLITTVVDLGADE